MSTQHPDNARPFRGSFLIKGELEIDEAFNAFSKLGCREQMWDCEGKEADPFVVKKLLTKYEDFFRANKLGKDVFLTLRVPNPKIERVEAKVFLETLEFIPRSFDVAKEFLKEEIPPIFEVIIPMTTSARLLQFVWEYYEKFIGSRGNRSLSVGKIREWVGDFKPSRIRPIPLIEDKPSLLKSAKIVENFLQDKDFTNQRVFLARSDPAMNYGLPSAVLLNKLALQEIQKLEEELSCELNPIIGVGSAPFRGNFKPSRVKETLKEYPSVQTFTIQSAFKYDHPLREVKKAIKKIQGKERSRVEFFPAKKIVGLIDKIEKEYRKCIKIIAPLVQKISPLIPSRRTRKLHIGLFGYSRKTGGIELPRAIKFCASLYSVGLPPEILGLGNLSEKDFDQLGNVYKKFWTDLQDALSLFNPASLKLLPQLREKIKPALKLVDFSPNHKHLKETSKIVQLLGKNRKKELKKHIEKAARIRKFLG